MFQKPNCVREIVSGTRRCFSNSLKNMPDLDFYYLCNPSNTLEIKNNIRKRKGIGDIDKVLELHNKLRTCSENDKESLRKDLIDVALKIPNRSHPAVFKLENEPVVIKTIGESRGANGELLQFHDIANKYNICRTDKISNFSGPRSYYLLDHLAILEQALIQYTLEYLKKFNFQLVSVPDVLPRSVIEACGMDTRGERNQVYSVSDKKYGDLCLSGTAEMGIACYLGNKDLGNEELPLKIAAVSRCFRAEISKISEEKGIYRVHQFTKVEMFGVTSPDDSDSLLNEFVSIQEDLYDSLELHLRILDMPPPELGAQASRKFDIEAWLPGKKMWGEISSASNCTDYQSRRLRIKNNDGYVHTINGTACAVPRLIIALLETHQKEGGSVELPKCLNSVLDSLVIKPSRLPKITEFKTRDRFV